MKKKQKKMRSFAKRLTRRIVLMQLIAMGIASVFIYIFVKDLVKMEELDLYRSYLNTATAKVERVLSGVSTGSSNHVPEIEENLDKPDRLQDIVEQVVSLNPDIRSCGISFVDGYYPKKGRWYCPYAVRTEEGQVERRNMGDADYNYLEADWFKEALEAEEAYWSKPFYDVNDSLMHPLVAYLIPIHDKEGNTVAVLGADIPLSQVRPYRFRPISKSGEFDEEGDEAIDLFAEDPEGTGDHEEKQYMNIGEQKWRMVYRHYIIDGDGTFIYHPDKDLVGTANYFDHAKQTPDSIDDYVGRKMVAGKKGIYCDEEGDPESFKFCEMDGLSVYMYYEPVANTNWSMSIAVPSYMIDLFAILLALIMPFLIGVGLLVLYIAGRIIIRRAVKPLKKLAASADWVAKGRFNTPLPDIKHNDEVKLLRDSFEKMQISLTRYVEDLKKTTASKAAIESELKVAHDIQMSMLPKTFPPYPDRHDVDIYGLLKPAKDVGGDLFDFFIRDEQLFFCIGDVSGKGVPASLVMAVTRSLFRNISAHVAEPHHIVRTLNKALTEGNETSMFVTLFVGVLDLKTGYLTYCNAGHNSPLFIGRGVGVLPCEPNLPLGIENDWDFVLQETALDPKTTIFLYTDGLNEAENISHSQFGEERIKTLAETLLADGKNASQDLVTAMAEAVHDFVGDAEQSDDLTMLAIRFLGVEAQNQPEGNQTLSNEGKQ